MESKQWCPEYVATGFVAEHCGVSSVTVLRWIEKGHLPAFRLPDGHYRIYGQDFIKFLADYDIPAPRESIEPSKTRKRAKRSEKRVLRKKDDKR